MAKVLLHGTGFISDTSENHVALGIMKDNVFEVKYSLDIIEVIKFDGSPDRIKVKIPLNAELGLYELRANTFDSIHWSNSVDFSIINSDIQIDIESIYPSEINIEDDSIISVFLKCYDSDNNKIDCNKRYKYAKHKYSSQDETEWFDSDNFTSYHSDYTFIIEFKGLSSHIRSQFIPSKLIDIQDNGNHLRFKILSLDITDPKRYGYAESEEPGIRLFRTPFISVRLIMSLDNKTIRLSRDNAIIINQKFGEYGYYDSFERTSNPPLNPNKYEDGDNGKVGNWEDSLYWHSPGWLRGSINGLNGFYQEKFDDATKYCNQLGMRLPTYQDFSKLIDPSQENYISPVFKSYFFGTYWFRGAGFKYWLRNGNRLVLDLSGRLYEQNASEFKDKFSHHTKVKCIGG